MGMLTETEVYLRNGIRMNRVGELGEIAAISDGDEDKLSGVEYERHNRSVGNLLSGDGRDKDMGRI